MGRYARKKQHKGNKVLRKFKTKHKTKDVDEIHEDLKPANRAKLVNQDRDLDVAGGAQHYCITCSKYCVSETALKDHFKSKPHKRRLKKLETEPYTQAEADRAAGMGSYVAPKKVKVDGQQVEQTMEQSDEETQPT